MFTTSRKRRVIDVLRQQFPNTSWWYENGRWFNTYGWSVEIRCSLHDSEYETYNRRYFRTDNNTEINIHDVPERGLDTRKLQARS